jgi:hypothetical protein
MGFILGLVIVGFSVYVVFEFVWRREARAGFAATLREKPVATLALIGMLAGIDLFMFWILTGHLGALGLSGFAFAALCLVVLWNCKNGF